MDIKERQLAVLEDTVKHYNSTNRSQDGLSCVYYPTDKSEGCAVGRLIKNKELCNTLGSRSVSTAFVHLPKEVKELGVEFLTDLQSLHDTAPFWDADGLTISGEGFVTQIKRDYDL